MTRYDVPAAFDPWLRISAPNPTARLRLFCFPYAGGTASIYRLWSRCLPADIEVCAVQLPGREERIREQPFTDMSALVQVLLPRLLPYLDRPFAFFGHSMGSLIAYELAQSLHQQAGLVPTHLLVSGRRAPFLSRHEAPVHNLPTDMDLLAELQRRYNNIPELVFTDTELRELFAPLLRADLTMVETYQPQHQCRLPCPIIACGGETDPHASRVELLAWQELTQAAFALHMFPGGHFYFAEQAEPLFKTLSGYLEKNAK